MKLIINRADISEHPEHFLRRVGYAFIRDNRTGKESFVRRLGSHFYPRLHMYVEERGDNITFDLHLDQKQASYQGARMHNAEHHGEVVENEIRRLKSFVTQNANLAAHNSQPATQNPITHNSQPATSNPPNPPPEANKELINQIGGSRDYSNIKSEQRKKSWWKKLFS